MISNPVFFYFDFDLKSTVILRFGIDKVKPYIRLIQIYIKAHEYTQRKETIFLFKWFLTLRIHTQIKIKIKSYKEMSQRSDEILF